MALAEDIATRPTKPVLHGDNSATLKATTVLAMLYWLGVKPSYSRRRVSDDNAYAESLFRTAKYRPKASPIWPLLGPGRATSCVGTTSIITTAASATSAQLNGTLVTITQSSRHDMNSTSTHDTGNWTPIGAVTLNPERDSRGGYGDGFRRYTAIGCITEATTTLTRAGSSYQPASQECSQPWLHGYSQALARR